MQLIDGKEKHNKINKSYKDNYERKKCEERNGNAEAKEKYERTLLYNAQKESLSKSLRPVSNFEPLMCRTQLGAATELVWYDSRVSSNQNRSIKVIVATSIITQFAAKFSSRALYKSKSHKYFASILSVLSPRAFASEDSKRIPHLTNQKI